MVSLTLDVRAAQRGTGLDLTIFTRVSEEQSIFLTSRGSLRRRLHYGTNVSVRPAGSACRFGPRRQRIVYRATILLLQE